MFENIYQVQRDPIHKENTVFDTKKKMLKLMNYKKFSLKDLS